MNTYISFLFLSLRVSSQYSKIHHDNLNCESWDIVEICQIEKKLANIALILVTFRNKTFVGEHRRFTKVSRIVCSNLLCISADRHACCAHEHTYSTTLLPVCDNTGTGTSVPGRTGIARASSCRLDTCICYHTWDIDIAAVPADHPAVASSHSRGTSRDRSYWTHTRVEY